MSSAAPIPTFVRASLLGILLFGILGLIIELFFLRHTEGTLELLPIWIMAASLVVVLWDAVRRSRASRGILVTLMAAFVVVGLAGVGLHYLSNIEYEREANPGATTGEVY